MRGYVELRYCGRTSLDERCAWDAVDHPVQPGGPLADRLSVERASASARTAS